MPEIPATLPWSDRGANAARSASPSPRSTHDVEILRSLSRRINVNDPGAHNNLGVVYYNKGLHEEAVEHFERALDLDPRMQVAERNLKIAYFATGFFETLVTNLRERLEQNPANVDTRERLARAYLYGGDPAAAMSELRQVIVARPDDPASYYRLARAEQQLGNLDGALETLNEAIRLEPANSRAQLLKGELLYQLGRAAEAREPLETAVRYDGEFAEAHHLLAFVYGDLGLMQRAESSAVRAAELNPSLTKAEANLSLDSYSAARYQELVGERSVPDVMEGGTLAHYNLGLAFRQKALYDEALREFRLAAERGEDALLVQQAEGEMLLLKGASEEAIALYSALLEQEEGSPKLWNELGVALHQLGRLDEAERSYRKSLEVDSDYALAWNNLGVVSEHLGQHEHAEHAFRAAIELGRALADSWRNLALVLWRRDRKDESLEAYERSLEYDSTSAGAWTGLGVAQMELGRAADAKAALIRAVELDPRFAEARYHLAFALSALGDYQGALRETKLALELDPYIPQPRFRLLIDLQFEDASVLAPELDMPARVPVGEQIRDFEFQAANLDTAFEGALPQETMPGAEPALSAAQWIESARRSLLQGQFTKATEEAQHAARAGADRNEVLLLQGDIYLRRGYAGEALERFLTVLRVVDGHEGESSDATLRSALRGTASCYLDLKRHHDAITHAERLLSLTPHDVGGQRLLAQALMQNLDYSRAVIVLEQARKGAQEDSALLTDLGSAYLGFGDLQRAEHALRRALDFDDMAVAARSKLGRILMAAGKHKDAAREFRAALDLIPSYGDAAFGLVELEQGRGQFNAAVNVLVDLLTVDPYHLDGLVLLGAVLEQSGRGRDAITAYERVLRFDPERADALAGLNRAGMGAPVEAR